MLVTSLYPVIVKETLANIYCLYFPSITELCQLQHFISISSTIISAYIYTLQSHTIRSLFIIELCDKSNHCWWCRLSICCVCLPVNAAFHNSWSFIIFMSKISASLVQLLLLLLLYCSCSCLNMLCFCAVAINTKALIKLRTNVF